MQRDKATEEKKEELAFRYVIRKTNQQSIYQDIIQHLKNLNVLGPSIVIKEDGIYFNHSLKEISFLLSPFPSKLMDFDKYSQLTIFGHTAPPVLDEVNIFVYDLLNKNYGITIEACGDLISEQVKNRVAFLRQKNIPSTADLELTPQDGDLPSVAKEVLTTYSGLGVGETHPDICGKELIIYLMSCDIPHLTNLYVEVGFSDTQQQLYQHFNQTNKMPEILLHCLIGEDKAMGMIERTQSNLIQAYLFNPYSYLGMMVMARMKNITINPIDTTIAFDSAHSLGNIDTLEFHEKRCLIMNMNGYDVITLNQRQNKYLIYDGSTHNKTLKKYNIYGIPAMLHIPYLTDQVWKNHIPVCDTYSVALICHNIMRVLLGQTIKVYTPPAHIPNNHTDCLRLIYLQELAQEVQDKNWEQKKHTFMKFIPNKSLPTQIDVLRKILKNLHQLSATEIKSTFNKVLMLLQDGFLNKNIQLNKPEEDTIIYFRAKFLQGMDILDPTYRYRHFADTLTPILKFNQQYAHPSQKMSSLP